MNNKEGYIYILSSYLQDTVILKLGYTSNPKKRLQQYKHHNPACEFEHCLQIENAKEREKSFHLANESIFGNEWYSYDMLDTMKIFLNIPVRSNNSYMYIYKGKTYRLFEEMNNKYYSKNIETMFETIFQDYNNSIIVFGICVLADYGETSTVFNNPFSKNNENKPVESFSSLFRPLRLT